MKKHHKWIIFVSLIIVIIILSLNLIKENNNEQEKIKEIEENTYIVDGSLYEKNKLDIIYKESITEEGRKVIENKYGLMRYDNTDEIVFQYKTTDDLNYEKFKKLIVDIEREPSIETVAGNYKVPYGFD